MSKPQIVLVPGAWHAPVHMATLAAKLDAHGYTIHTQQMPSVGSPNPPEDLSEDAAALHAMAEKAIGTDNDVVVICHSWGGMVTGSGLVGLSKKEREAEGKQGGVVSLGYIAAMLMEEGTNLTDIAGSDHPPWVKVEVRFFHLYMNPSLALRLLVTMDKCEEKANMIFRCHICTQLPQRYSTMTSRRLNNWLGSQNYSPMASAVYEQRQRLRVGRSFPQAICCVRTI
jgi:hypothetical protein